MENWFQSDDIILAELRRTGSGPRPALGIPGYEDLRELKRGGQGVVYLATQRSTKRRVAIKVLLEAVSSEAGRRRFEREVDLIASLNHPNVVQIFDSGTTPDGRPYYVMEYIDGAPLDELIQFSERAPAGKDAGSLRRRRKGKWEASARSSGPTASTNQDSPSASNVAASGENSFSVPISVRQATAALPLDAALRLFATICDAVHYAHQRGVIHRDLKPSNIRVDRSGVPHVLDFGLAKLTTESRVETAVHLSTTGQFMGSLPWASPEQAEGHVSKLDIRTDIYSLGVILFQLLTGRFPYDVTGPLRLVFNQIVHAVPDKPSKFRRDLNDEIDTIVTKCLAKEPDRRYQSAGDLARDIRRYLAGEPIEAKRDSAWYTLRKAAARYKTAARVTAGFLMLSILALVVSLNYWMEARRQRDAARDAEDKARVAAETARAAEERARAALAVAEDEAGRASEINKFLTATLSSIDPYKVGHTLSISDFLKRASDDAGKRFEKRPRTEAEVRDTLAMSYWSLGMLEEAYREYQRSAALMAPSRDQVPRQIYHQNGNIASLVADLGRLDEAERLQREVARQALELFGEDSDELLTARGNWALTLERLGRISEAEPILRDVLQKSQRLLGPDHSMTASFSNNLGSLLIGQLRYDEAEPYVLDALRIRRAAVGPTHPDTLVVTGNLAQIRHGQGRRDEAAELFREQLRGAEEALGPAHPLVADAAANYAVLLQELGHLDEAEQLCRRAIEIYSARVGANHPDALRTRNVLSGVLVAQGRPVEAIPLCREVLEGMRRTYGPESKRALVAASNLALVLDEAGQYDEAVTVSEQALQTRRRLLGDSDHDTLVSMNNHGWLLLRAGRKQEAVDLWEHTFRTAPGAFPPGDPALATFENSYGYGLAQMGQFEEGERHLLVALETMRATLGPGSPRTRRVAQRLAEVYDLWGKPEKALEYRRLLERAETQPTP